MQSGFGCECMMRTVVSNGVVEAIRKEILMNKINHCTPPLCSLFVAFRYTGQVNIYCTTGNRLVAIKKNTLYKW